MIGAGFKPAPSALTMVPASRGTSRLESKASALDRQAKAEALDSKCLSLAGTMTTAAARVPNIHGCRGAFFLACNHARCDKIQYLGEHPYGRLCLLRVLFGWRST